MYEGISIFSGLTIGSSIFYDDVYYLSSSCPPKNDFVAHIFATVWAIYWQCEPHIAHTLPTNFS